MCEEGHGLKYRRRTIPSLAMRRSRHDEDAYIFAILRLPSAGTSFVSALRLCYTNQLLGKKMPGVAVRILGVFLPKFGTFLLGSCLFSWRVLLKLPEPHCRALFRVV